MEYASTKQISFNFEKETDSLEVWYDQKQMQKVINNLLSNAIKHTLSRMLTIENKVKQIPPKPAKTRAGIKYSG